MRNKLQVLSACLGLFVAIPAWPQSTADQTPADQPAKVSKKKAGRSPGGDIGSGAGNIGTGVARGAGSAAAGTARGAADVATLHPVQGAGAVGGGTVKAGSSIATGTARGAGKIGKGVGRAFKKLF
jgi:hypothetical protein